MLASRQSRTKRRGVVLILVLAMLGLLAVIGITFATYSGQAKINARNYAVSVLQPQADELFDFALGQLIGDTSDSRSVIRGHSLARDMYGNDAFYNGQMTINPETGLPFAINNVAAIPGSNLYSITTNILMGDPNFYGYNFTRWIMRVTYTGAVPSAGNQPVDSTLEILQVNPAGTPGPNTVFVVSPIDNPVANSPIDNPGAGTAFNTLTALFNPTLGSTSNLAMNVAAGIANIGGMAPNLNNFSFSLDGRYLRAFNGPGMGANGVYGNFRYNGMNPHQAGMDEDYDACDLENWFLALQSADGQVMIPSFHRPAAIRTDVNAGVDDWKRVNIDGNNNTTNWATSAARILRPVAADGNDAATFGDLRPDPNTGKITYDVDNDGDGMNDSVWLDLGYPARRDSKNQLYKPLFAFMVIGLNGRIPLNTAGNLADQRDASAPIVGYDAAGNPIFGPGGGASHALHLGNSVSEIDPTYALQNAFTSPLLNANSNDYVTAFAAPQTGVALGVNNTVFALNSQVDNASIDVRLTQFRNLLSGTRPPGNGNHDTNYVYSSSAPTQGGLSYPLPNGIADAFDYNGSGPLSDQNGNLYVERTTQPVPGRYGEAQAIPGVKFNNPNYVMGNGSHQFVDVVTANYANPVRAGYSMDPTDIMFGTPRDVADDNYNSYDPYPIGHTGEAGDQDFYDNSGALLLPVDRMRRWLTPADINGTGTVTQWNAGANPVRHGPDLFGRVEFYSYFRPPGSPGVLTFNPFPQGYRSGAVSISYPASGTPYAPDSTGNAPLGQLVNLVNNPLHGFESFRFPSQNYTANPNAPGPNNPGSFTPQRIGGMPVDQFVDANNMPTAFPTYDFQVNATVNSDGLNEADEMNLYSYNPLLDSPYGPSDLEWLYRQQDVDGASLSSRLKQLAPISFTNGIDGQRRRRLFALDTWESNGFAWANDNPGGVFPNNSRFTAAQNASLVQAGGVTPALAQRDRKINLNYPLPVSNDPNEPIRQKWISDTYQMLKAVLPPKAVDTPEELAQLSQYVINIVDFRDSDSTMTHWVNPDVVLTNVLVSGAAAPVATTRPPSLAMFNPAVAFAPGIVQLDQYGMEYNPVAINEALAYTFTYQTAAAGATTSANRFFIELVNTLTDPEFSTASVVHAGQIDLGGFQYTRNDPYSGGCWDIVFTGDDPYSRPDPFRGELPRFGNIYGLTPLNQDSFSPPPAPYTGAATTGANVVLQPLLASRVGGMNGTSIPLGANYAAGGTGLPTNYFYVFGNSPPSAMVGGGGGAPNVYETGPLQPGMAYTGSMYPGTAAGTGNLNNYTIPLTTSGTYAAPVTQALSAATGFDPFQSGAGATNPGFLVYTGVLPGILENQNAPPQNYQWKVPPVMAPAGGAGGATQRNTQFFWVCLRRPANLFAPVSAYNPMVVVDAMRLPYIDGTGSNATTANLNDNGTIVTVPSVNGTFNSVYSVQRFQPYRGGHAVPVPPAVNYGFSGSTYTVPATAGIAIDPRYGYTEQVVPPSANSLAYVNPATGAGAAASASLTQGIYYYKDATVQTGSTFPVFHTLGLPNEWEMGSGMTVQETWDYVPFHDRDFTSVAELMLVPASPPGLFTKQFVEVAPSQQNLFTFFSGYAGTGGTQVMAPAPAGVTAASVFTASGAIAQGSPGVFVGAGATGTVFNQTFTNTTSMAAPGGNSNNPQPYLPLFTFGAPPANTTPATPYGPAPGYLYANTGAVGGGGGGGGGGGMAGTMAAYVNVASASVPLLFAGALNGAAAPFAGSATSPAANPAQITPPPVPTAPIQPHSYLYLSDRFFYSGFGGNPTAQLIAPDGGGVVGGYAADGWFKMFEFFEVPSQMFGAIGPAAQGTNFDWARQDFKPGLLNLNLIIDEEVYLGLLGNTGINQQNGQPSVPSIPPTNPPTLMANTDESDQFSQQLLNMAQVPPLPAGNYTPFGTALSLQSSGPPYLLPIVPAVGSPAPGPIPLVVTATLNNGAPASAYPLSSTSLASWQSWASFSAPYQAYPLTGAGAVAADPVANYNNQTFSGPAPTIYNNALKASFVQFLWLRHGGSGYMFGWGNGAVGENVAYGGANGQVGGGNNGFRIPAEIPFRSLSFPDIDHTVMRPAALPPTNNTSPAPNSAPVPTASPPLFYAGDPGVRSPNIYVNYVGGAAVPTANQAYTQGYYPGVLVTATAAGLIANYSSVFPPPIPARRLFQFPDFYPGTSGSVPSSTIPAPSNSSETGDPFVNNTTPAAAAVPIAAPGVPTATVQTQAAATTYTTVPSNGMVNLYWANGTAGTQYVSTGVGGTPIPAPSNPYLGAQSAGGGAAGIVGADFRQHPYWRSEEMQRVMNLTTVRTHQYAVWVTVAFFQVKRQGDIGMASIGVPTLAYDIMGPENGALDGSNVRFRAFFLIDRLKLTGFDPGNAGQFHQAVVYSNRIQ